MLQRKSVQYSSTTLGRLGHAVNMPTTLPPLCHMPCTNAATTTTSCSLHLVEGRQAGQQCRQDRQMPAAKRDASIMGKPDCTPWVPSACRYFGTGVEFAMVCHCKRLKISKPRTLGLSCCPLRRLHPLPCRRQRLASPPVQPAARPVHIAALFAAVLDRAIDGAPLAALALRSCSAAGTQEVGTAQVGAASTAGHPCCLGQRCRLSAAPAGPSTPAAPAPTWQLAAVGISLCFHSRNRSRSAIGAVKGRQSSRPMPGMLPGALHEPPSCLPARGACLPHRPRLRPPEPEYSPSGRGTCDKLE